MKKMHSQFNKRNHFLVLFIAVLLLLVSSYQAGSAGALAAQQPVEPQGPRIVGGQEAIPGAWPWQVALIQAGGDLYFHQYCGGSLIDEEWVLTAAHCADGALPSQIEIAVGVHDLSQPEPGFQRRAVSQIVIHPNYNFSTFDSDIALLKLATPVALGQPSGGLPVGLISPVAASSGALVGVMATTTGWGNRAGQPLPGGNDYPTTLHQVDVPIMSDSDCQFAYGNTVTANMLCAGYLAGGKDSCQGDSGGPLVFFDPSSQRWQQAGVVSWGFGCAAPNSPGVYTRLSQFSDWISAVTNPIIPTDFVYLPVVR